MKHVTYNINKLFVFNSREEGVTLYLTIVVISVLTGAFLMMIGISLTQIETIWTLGDSVSAFYAADTGIEHSLYNFRCQGGTGEVSGSLENSSYSVELSDSTIFISTGAYKEAQRAIEAVF